MYLSQLILNPRNRRVQRELADLYQLHRSLMRAFPEEVSPEDERVLFRVDEHPRFGVPALLVQSLTLPDWSWLGQDPGARGYLLPVDVPNPAVKPLNLHLATGQVLVFRLRANPTVKRAGKRRGLVREEDQRAWLERKAAEGGFRVLSVRITREGAANGEVRRGEEAHNLLLLAVRFDGLLQVVDPERLVATVQRGVGSGKGFGFGLLSLAPGALA